MKKSHGKDKSGATDNDDAALWHHTVRSIRPLKRAKPRVYQSEEQAAAPPRSKSRSETSASPKRQVPTPQQPPPAASRPAPPIADFDRKKVKRLRSGRAGIEARIDLHGMRQDEAHAALRAFLHRAHGRGYRMVLVITGKGKMADRSRDEPFDMTQDRDRGVLKRNVPRWLEEPDLRALVVSYTSAAIMHGGEGALYVHLRKRV